MEVIADLSKPPGERVVKIEVGGLPLDSNARYSLATNDFMAAGGDGYRSFVDADRLIDAADARLIATQVIDYVASKAVVAPKVEGRIRLVEKSN